MVNWSAAPGGFCDHQKEAEVGLSAASVGDPVVCVQEGMMCPQL
jgi:hypothetical protein